MDSTALPPEVRIEIDSLHQRIGRANHYELLGVVHSADRSTVVNAYAVRVRRLRPTVPIESIPPEYRARLDALMAALEEAQTVLSDPVKRFLYDQALVAQAAQTQAPRELSRAARAQEVGTSASVSAVRPSSRPPPGAAPPRSPSHTSHPAIYPPGPALPVIPEPIPPLRPVTSVTPPAGTAHRSVGPPGEIVVPPPLRRGQTPAPMPGHRADSAPVPRSTSQGVPAMDSPATPSMEARLAALEAHQAEMQGDLGQLLADLERVTAATQLCLAQLSEQSGPHQHQMLAALNALVGTRATVASLLARREESAGRWDNAAALWQRAARSRPNDPHLLVRAAESIRRAGGDLAAAESLARQALEITPDYAPAHTVLTALSVRRA